MTTKDFCYWLMGSLELNENEGFNEEQTKIVKNHLNMVFHHEIDSNGDFINEESSNLYSGVNTPLERC